MQFYLIIKIFFKLSAILVQYNAFTVIINSFTFTITIIYNHNAASIQHLFGQTNIFIRRQRAINTQHGKHRYMLTPKIEPASAQRLDAI